MKFDQIKVYISFILLKNLLFVFQSIFKLAAISSSNKEGKSEQALVSYNTDRAHDLQADATDIGLNLKQFPPPNTAEKYYFSSPGK